MKIEDLAAQMRHKAAQLRNGPLHQGCSTLAEASAYAACAAMIEKFLKDKDAENWFVDGKDDQWCIVKHEWGTSRYLGPNGERFTMPHYYSTKEEADGVLERLMGTPACSAGEPT